MQLGKLFLIQFVCFYLVVVSGAVRFGRHGSGLLVALAGDSLTHAHIIPCYLPSINSGEVLPIVDEEKARSTFLLAFSEGFFRLAVRLVSRGGD